MKVVGLDLGGTKIAAGVFDGKRLLSKVVVPTPKEGGERVAEALAEAAERAERRRGSGGGHRPGDARPPGLPPRGDPLRPQHPGGPGLPHPPDPGGGHGEARLPGKRRQRRRFGRAPPGGGPGRGELPLPHRLHGDRGRGGPGGKGAPGGARAGRGARPPDPPPRGARLRLRTGGLPSGGPGRGPRPGAGRHLRLPAPRGHAGALPPLPGRGPQGGAPRPPGRPVRGHRPRQPGEGL